MAARNQTSGGYREMARSATDSVLAGCAMSPIELRAGHAHFYCRNRQCQVTMFFCLDNYVDNNETSATFIFRLPFPVLWLPFSKPHQKKLIKMVGFLFINICDII